MNSESDDFSTSDEYPYPFDDDAESARKSDRATVFEAIRQVTDTVDEVESLEHLLSIHNSITSNLMEATAGLSDYREYVVELLPKMVKCSTYIAKSYIVWHTLN